MSSEGTPLHGDRGAWNVIDFDTEHSRDIMDSTLRRHLPLPAAAGGYARSDGTDWQRVSSIALADLADYTAGFIIVGGGADWEAAAFDWDTLSVGAGADMVHTHTSNAEGGTIGVAAISDIATTYLKLDASNDPITGDLILTPTANSTSTFLVEQSNGTDILRVDTTNAVVKLGDGTNYAQFDADGDLTFTGTGDYLVANDAYAFRSLSAEDAGLFYNAVDSRYEFRSGAGVATTLISPGGDVQVVGLSMGLAAAGGKFRAGATGNYAEVQANGILSFVGTGYFRVNAEQYAFRGTTTNAGLFFTGTGNSRFQFLNTASGAMLTMEIAGNVGINKDVPTAQLDIDQSSTTAAKPVLKMDQGDVSEPFTDYIGTSAASAANSLSSWTTGNAVQGHVQIDINGVKRWLRFYDDPTS